MARQKTLDEVKLMEETQRVAEAAMAAVIEYLRTSSTPTSEDAHAIVDKVLAEHDCESPIGHIVAGGLQAAEPHERGTGPIERGVPIVIDIFPRSKKSGYWADMSRTVCIGNPTAEAEKMYDTVLAAQELGISLMEPGAECKSIQEAVEKFFNDAGYETTGKGTLFAFAGGFVHGLGHGVGREIHEAPRIGRKTEDVLTVGDVVTIEPGLYYKHIGGVRIEDMVLITADGHLNLARYPKDFVL